MNPPSLLTDPFLQLPAASSVRVVWFTEFAGTRHVVHYGENFQQTAIATTTQLSRTREDADSCWREPIADVRERPIWRHEAEISGLAANRRVPYRVTSTREDGESVSSEAFTLAPAPTTGTPLKILLTSDHQLKPLVTANLQKVVETIGPLDLVLFAGDLVNVPDRASEWFDDRRGNAFFPALQGRGSYALEKNGVTTYYRGGAILQQTPMYAAIGNHEVMGRFSTQDSLDHQFNNSVPRHVAKDRYSAAASPEDNCSQERWLKDHSFNTDTYEEILTLPQSPSGGRRYYAVSFGDVRLIVLYITNVWRSFSLGAESKGKFREREADLNQPENWGYGQHLFEPIVPGSPQHTWLLEELNHPEFQQATYKVVMFHHPPHTLGENGAPAYTDPIQMIERDDAGSITAICYEYPKQDDYIIRDVVPLLEQAGVQLVYFGHSHLWNRFVSPGGLHFLESSNVGNSYGAYLGEIRRKVPPGIPDYAEVGDPNGLEPIVPTIAPLLNDEGQPQPFIASNDITVFSILDTGTGVVTSYRFDTRLPDSPAIPFDAFSLLSTYQGCYPHN